DETRDGGGLERSRNVREQRIRQLPLFGAMGLDREPNGRLQAAEAEVNTLIPERPRKREALRVAGYGQRRKLRPAGVRQGQQPSHLVEGLAGRIVQSLADDPVSAETLNVDELRVTARDEQGQKREGRRILLEHAREEVALHMVD